MEKTIKISNQEYVIKSSAYTMFAYKDFTGRDLLNDVQSLKNMYYEINKLPTKEERDNAWMEKSTSIIKMGLKMCYVMIKEKDKSFVSYEEWLESLDNLFDNTEWLMDTMEVAMSPFQRKLHNAEESKASPATIERL